MKSLSKSHLLFITLFISFNGFGQALSEDFLNSLPSDIRGDVLKNIDNDISKDKKPYGYIDTNVDELSKAIEDLKNELGILESRVAKRDISTLSKDSSLKRFGEDFFTSTQSTFMPVNSPNLPGDYLIDVNDTLEVLFVGQKNEKFEASVFRDGSISIPEIGKVYVAGLPFSEVANLIEETVSQNFIGVQSFVSVSSMRDMNIFVTGGVESPGMYTLSGNSSVINAIAAAGGITNTGSFRSVVIKRNNEVIDAVDLYEAFAYGNISFNHSLRSGDVVLIESSSSEISIKGAVGNQARFEFKNNESLGDIIKFAGGLSQHFDNKKNFSIYRNFNGARKIVNIDASQADTFKLSKNDEVIIPAFTPSVSEGNFVEIEGEVNFPGRYLLTDGAKLSDLIEIAGGYTDFAHINAGKLFRESAKIVEMSINQRLYDETIKFISSAPSNSAGNLSFAQSNLEVILREFKNIKPIGRVRANFNPRDILLDPTQDIFLEPNDKIVIPKFTNTVFVLGDVLQPGSAIFNPSFSAIDYIDSAGGIDRFGDQDRIVLIKPSGESLIINNRLLPTLFGDDKMRVVPGSVIFVPRYIGKLDNLGLLSSVAPIVSSMAISLASINSISNN